MLVTISLNTPVESFDDFAEYLRVLKPFFQLGEVAFKRGVKEAFLTGGLRADLNELLEGRELLVELMHVLHVIPNVTMELKRVEAWAGGEPATANLEYDSTNMELMLQTTDLLTSFPAFVITLRSGERKPTIMPVDEPVSAVTAEVAAITIDGVAATELQVQGLNMAISEMEISVRLNGCLLDYNCVHLGEMCEKTDKVILQIPNLEHESLKELKSVMAFYDLRPRIASDDEDSVRVKRGEVPMFGQV